MTPLELEEVLALPIDELISTLQVSSFDIPAWSTLEPQYDPMQHEIWDETVYPKKADDAGNDDFKRTALALQKLAVNRTAQSMFATPAKRSYAYDKASTSQKHVVDVVEHVYHTDNYIDAENVERAKQLHASCEIVTIWRVYEKENIVAGETTKYKIGHKTYSAQKGYDIYAQTDDNGELIVVSIVYEDSSDVEHMDIYTNGDTPEFRRLDNLEDGWTLNEEVSQKLGIFPVVHTHIEEPIWGGDAGTTLVQQLEEMESYQGLYIKRNALPTFTLDYGETKGNVKTDVTEKSTDSRRIIRVGAGGAMKDVTWKGAGESVNDRYARIRNSYFEHIQVPDTSFANMIKSNTSAENKELIFADAKAKARDLGGEWERLFYTELSIVMELLKVLFPTLAADIALMSVSSQIQPYSIKSKTENAEFVAVGGSGMSLATKVRELGVADDIAQEVIDIQTEAQTDANVGL